MTRDNSESISHRWTPSVLLWGEEESMNAQWGWSGSDDSYCNNGTRPTRSSSLRLLSFLQRLHTPMDNRHSVNLTPEGAKNENEEGEEEEGIAHVCEEGSNLLEESQ